MVVSVALTKSLLSKWHMLHSFRLCKSVYFSCPFSCYYVKIGFRTVELLCNYLHVHCAVSVIGLRAVDSAYK
jgi:hypothetical protein